MNSVYDKVIVMFCNKQLQLFTLYYHFFLMCLNELEHWRKQKRFSQIEIKLGLYHVVLTTPKTSPEKITLTLVEMQQLPEIEKVDSKN